MGPLILRHSNYVLQLIAVEIPYQGPGSSSTIPPGQRLPAINSMLQAFKLPWLQATTTAQECQELYQVGQEVVLALNEVQSDCHLPGRFVMVCAFCAPVGDEMRTSWHKFNSSNLLPETIDHCSSSLIQCTNISTSSAGLVLNTLCLPVHQTTVSARPTSQN